jgi:hypothetical protein
MTRSFAASMSVLALLAGSLAADSLDYVTTQSSIFDGEITNNYDSIAGLSQHGGGANQSWTFTSNPTTSITGLTSSFTSITNGYALDTQNGSYTMGQAYATANLATGTVGVSSSGQSYNGDGTISLIGVGWGTALGQMQDAITFDNTTGGTAYVTVTWTVDGSVVSTPGTDNQNLDFVFCLSSGNCSGNPSGYPLQGGGAVFQFQDSGGALTTTMPTSGYVSTSITPGANNTSFTFTGVIAVPEGMSADGLNAYLSDTCGNGTTCDFSHTGTLGISDPAGVSFTSNSGVLLTQQTTSTVPEPSTYGLMLAEMSLVVFQVRRRIQQSRR